MTTTVIATVEVSRHLSHKRGHVYRLSVEDRCATQVGERSTPPNFDKVSEDHGPQLAPLASQHHLSEYNRLKFGPKGCPVPYIPLSLHVPEYLQELEARQAPFKATFYEGPENESELSRLEDDLAEAIKTPLAAPVQSSIKTSESHPINVSSIIPAELVSSLSPYILTATSIGRKSLPTLFDVPPALTLDNLSSYPISTYSAIPFGPLPPSRQINVQTPERGRNTDSRPAMRHNLNANTSMTPVTAPLSMGNLFLSSCPGKRVRLEAPSEPTNRPTRTPIARSLPTDLYRIKSLGVSLLVCLLPTEELSLLGAAWPAYLAAAHALGLSVLRVPVVEGLGLSGGVENVDEWIQWVIERWTRQGKSVLVHCRGGVGRAGVWASCWAIRLGLIGPVQPYKEGDERSTEAYIRRDTLAIVERAVGAVRKRRSVKAIETYEQVKFLVEYVEYLRAKASMG